VDKVRPAREDGARVGCFIADCNDPIEALGQIALKTFVVLLRDVDAQLCHHLHGLRPNHGRYRTGAVRFESITGQAP
jgi:hypothetical protein